MHREKSLADRVFHVLMSWGKKAMVVNVPPKRPMRVVESISEKYLNKAPIY